MEPEDSHKLGKYSTIRLSRDIVSRQGLDELPRLQLLEQLGSQACTTRLDGTACFLSCLFSCISFPVFGRDGLMSQHGKEHIAHIYLVQTYMGVFNGHM